jgi:alkylation response protein AidB-like acyl-CoA dehydrogenase
MDSDSRTAGLGAGQRTSTPASEMPRSSAQINGTETVDRILADIDALAPEIASRASEAEAARRIPNDIVQALKAIGVFRLTAPRAKGGLELDFPASIRILQRLTKIDGSVGWFCTLRAGGSMFCRYCRTKPTKRFIDTVRMPHSAERLNLLERPRRSRGAGASAEDGHLSEAARTPTGSASIVC